MAKIWIILLIAFAFEALGVIALKQGLDVITVRYSERKTTTTRFKNVLKLVGDWFTSKKVLLGLLLETIFFIMLQYLLAQRDVSFVWPLTAMTFVTATFAAKFLLHEHVDATRWSGVVLIVLGAVLISYSEHRKPETGELPVQSQSIK